MGSMVESRRVRSFRSVAAVVLVLVAAAIVSLLLQPTPGSPEPDPDDRRDLPAESPPPVSVTEPQVAEEQPGDSASIIVAVSSSSGLVDPGTVKVVLQRDKTRVTESDRTGSRLTFTDLVPGRYELSFNDGSGSIPMPGIDLLPGATELVDLDVRGRSSLHIVAHCTFPFVDRLKVVLMPLPFAGQIVTRLDEDGEATCLAPRGSIQIRLVSDGVTLITDEWVLSKAHETRELHLELEPVALQVLGGDGKPLPACRVEYEASNLSVASLTVDTDEQGQATIAAMRGVPYRFLLTSREYGSKTFNEKPIPISARPV